MISNLEYLSPLGHSDHNILKFEFTCFMCLLPLFCSVSLLSVYRPEYMGFNLAVKDGDQLETENLSSL